MAKTYTVDIIDGQGTKAITNGTYSVTASVNGYDNSTIDPDSVTISSSSSTYDFEISATGTLTLHVTEDGTIESTPIVGATFYRCDSEGTTYGDLITTNSSGEAVFNNVPYASSDAPLIYYKQTASDESHNFDDTLKSISLTTATYQQEIANPIASTVTVTLTDKNYANLPIGTGQLTLTN